jgi:hypothetical protein
MIPPGGNAAFVAAMEEVLAVYARPVDPRRPLVCFDEAGKDLKAPTRLAQPVAPGRAAREDSEYARHGSRNLFLACAPHLGWRQIVVTAQRTAIDFAHALRDLVDGQFPQAERIVLVLDHLNTHTPAALYHAFPPAEAWRILERIEWHYTPTHGSWLNLAELEWSVLARSAWPGASPIRPRWSRKWRPGWRPATPSASRSPGTSPKRRRGPDWLGSTRVTNRTLSSCRCTEELQVARRISSDIPGPRRGRDSASSLPAQNDIPLALLLNGDDLVGRRGVVGGEDQPQRVHVVSPGGLERFA